MDLQEEYLTRRKVKTPCVKYIADRANLILKSKGDAEWTWLHVNIASTVLDQNHPQKFNFVVNANPSIYSTNDYQHFGNQSKTVKEMTWEWEQYEPGLIEWAKEFAPKYTAVTSQDAVFVAWEMFTSNYDTWMAHFLPCRLHEQVYKSLSLETRESRIGAIKEVEDYMKASFNNVFACWKNIRNAIEQKNYADWLAKIVNEI